MAQLKKQIAKIDLSAAVQRVGGKFFDNRLTLKILGKDFSVDSEGNLFSDIHINSWVAVPFLNFVSCQGHEGHVSQRRVDPF